MPDEIKGLDMTNPAIRQLVKGGVTANPAYNPKAKGKKAKSVPPTIIDNTPKPVSGGVWDTSASALQAIHYDNNSLGMTPEEFSSYREYGATPGPYKTREELNRIRANNQSAWSQTGRAIGQAVVNEVAIGTLLGLSNLVDMGINLTTPKGQDDYTNPFSEALETAQDDVRKRWEIYRADPNETWAVDDFGWWADNAVSIASTASMLIPSTAVVKGLSALGRVGKLGKISRGIAKAAHWAELTKTPATLAKGINVGAEIGASALLSRTMEGYLEARGVYKEVYDTTLDKVNNMTTEQKNELIKNNPEFATLDNESIAKYISSVSADETFKNDYAMLLFDVAQFKAINSLWKGVANKATTTATQRLLNQQAIKSLVNESEDVATKFGFMATKREALNNILKNPLTSLGAIELSEGIEEGFQGIQTEKGKEVAQAILDPNFTPRSLNSYLSDGAIWEQAFWGVLGGVGFQAIGTGLGNLSNKIEGRINKKNMSEQDYALSQLTEEKIRENEILSRKTLMNDYTASMKMLNEGKNPFGYVLDPMTKQPVLQDGAVVNEDISLEEAEQMKSKLTNDFITNMTLNAVDVGNYDLLREFVSDGNFDRYFQEAGLEKDSTDDRLSAQLLDKMDKVNEYYNSALYDILNSVDVEDQQVAKLAGRNIAKARLEVEDLDASIDNLNAIIYNDSDYNSNDYSAYEDKLKADYVEQVLNSLNEEETRLLELFNNKQLSPQALEKYKEELIFRRKQIVELAADIPAFYERDIVSDLLKQHIYDRSAVDFMKDFNAFLKEQRDNGQDLKEPKKSIVEVMNKKIDLEDKASYLVNTIPTDQREYVNLYNELNNAVGKIAVDRMNAAVDKVNEYLENAPDLQQARDLVIADEVPELKNELEILKIGHHNTENYTKQINFLIKEINARKAREAEANKVVKVNNKTVSPKEASNIKNEVDQIDAETDQVREDESPSSTGEGQLPDTSEMSDVIEETPTPVNVSEVQRDVDEVDKGTRDYIESIDKEYAEDYDFAASGKASLKTFDLFRTSRNMFDRLEGKDTTSEEFNEIVDIIEQQLLDEQVSKGYARTAAIEGIKLAMLTINRRMTAKGMEGADKFKRLADEIATKTRVNIDPEANATTSLIPETELNTVIDEFVASYVSVTDQFVPSKGKTVIDLEKLFSYMMAENDLGFNEIKHIFYNIIPYINTPNDRFVFRNRLKFNQATKNPSLFFNNVIASKSVAETIDSYMHISAPTIRDSKFDEAVQRAINGDNVTLSYFKGDRGTSKNSISIKIGDTEIGYLGSVIPNADNTEYRLASQNKNFVYNIKQTDLGYESNLDEFFTGVISQSNANYTEIMNLVYKQYAADQARQNNQVPEYVTEKEKADLMRNPEIVNLINKGLYKTGSNPNVNALLNAIGNVVLYDAEATTVGTMLESYEYWKINNFNNYKNTHAIQLALDKGQNVVTKLVNTGSAKLLYSNDNVGINTLAFDYNKHPIVFVNNQGNIINEKADTSYNNVAGFSSHTMGFLVADNPNAPMISLFTDGNTLSSNKPMYDAVRNELTRLFTGFQNKEVSYNTLYDSLADLFSGPNVPSNNLFSGYSVVENGNRLALNIAGMKGSYNLIIHKFEKGSNIEGTGITYIPNGDVSRAISSVSPNRDMIKDIVKEITDNLKFNKTYYAINNKNVDNESSNRYISKVNGLLSISINNFQRDYTSFGHYALDNNAFLTNQSVGQDGSFFDNSDKVKSLFIDVARINSPVEDGTLYETMTNATDLIKTATKTKSINTVDLLTTAGIDVNVANVLTGGNEANIDLIPDKVYFDKKATKSNAYYSKGKVYFTNKGATAIRKNPKDLVRLLIHENLHDKIEKQGLFQRDGIVTDLIDTYTQFVQEIDNDYYALDKADPKYKRVASIRNWIEDNHFTPEEYFNYLSPEQRRVWDNAGEVERLTHFAEEWLVETLSQPAIIKYLNETTYRGYEFSIDGIDDSNKTIWQKIIDILLRLFNKDSGNLNNNSILARQYYILSDVESAKDVTNENKVIVESANDNYNEVAGDPLNNNEIEQPTADDVSGQNRGTAVDRSNNDNAEKRKNRRERFATTSNVDNYDEAIINSYADTSTFNGMGVARVDDMNNYLKRFPLQDRAKLAQMLASGTLKYVCQ